MAVEFPYSNNNAGTEAARGTYNEAGTSNGAPYGYNGTYYARYMGIGEWWIASDMTGEPAQVYYAAGDVNNFPLTGWVAASGDEPAPEFAGASSGHRPGRMMAALFD